MHDAGEQRELRAAVFNSNLAYQARMLQLGFRFAF